MVIFFPAQFAQRAIFEDNEAGASLIEGANHALQPERITLAAALLLTATLALAGSSPAAGQTLFPVAYLPIISRAPTNPIHTGIATYYYATGAGACGFRGLARRPDGDGD